IHLDHAGAVGHVVRDNPQIRVHVSEIGAPHIVDPTRLINSARRLYGDQLETLYGEPLPVPQENVEVVWDTAAGLKSFPTPGHASHHVCYLDEEGTLFAGDATGVRIVPGRHVLPHAPPPDIDLEAWEQTFDDVLLHQPARLALIHFGVVEGTEDVAEHVERARNYLGVWAKRVLDGMTEQEFVAAARADLDARIALTVLDAQSWYRQLTVFERVVDIHDDPDFVDADVLSIRYTRKPFGDRTRHRVSAEIELDSWYGWEAASPWPPKS